MPLSSESYKCILIWDDTAPITAVAIVNPGAIADNVAITVRDSFGHILATASRVLPARTKTAFRLRDLPGLNVIAGKRGSAEFSVTAGTIAVLGLRFGNQAFTSIPTQDQ